MGLVVGLTLQTTNTKKSSKLDAVIVWPSGENSKDLDKRLCSVWVLDRPLDMVASVVMEELKKVA